MPSPDFGVGGVEVDGTGGFVGGMLILRTLSRMICWVVFAEGVFAELGSAARRKIIQLFSRIPPIRIRNN